MIIMTDLVEKQQDGCGLRNRISSYRFPKVRFPFWGLDYRIQFIHATKTVAGFVSRKRKKGSNSFLGFCFCGPVSNLTLYLSVFRLMQPTTASSFSQVLLLTISISIHNRLTRGQQFHWLNTHI